MIGWNDFQCSFCESMLKQKFTSVCSTVLIIDLKPKSIMVPLEANIWWNTSESMAFQAEQSINNFIQSRWRLQGGCCCCYHHHRIMRFNFPNIFQFPSKALHLNQSILKKCFTTEMLFPPIDARQFSTQIDLVCTVVLSFACYFFPPLPTHSHAHTNKPIPSV